MDFRKRVNPMDGGVSKVLILSLAIIAIAVGASIFSFAYLLASYSFEPVIYGIVMVWIGSIAFFYAVITEEHTLKELFLRQSYFFTGLLVMILGLFFVSLAGLSTPVGDMGILEFGLLLLLLGAGLVILSAQRTYDYSKMSGFFALFAGFLMMLGGVMAGSMNVAYAGVFVVMLAGIWLGMRDRYAQ
jgi:hypothetical protein